MNKHIQRLKKILIDRPLDEIMDISEQEGPKQALKKSVPFLVAGVVSVGLLVMVLALIYTARGTIWKVAVLVVMGGVLVASYRENHRPTIGPATTKAPTMEQYITVGNIVKLAAKKVAATLGLVPIYEESDTKAAKGERIVPYGKCWLFKYRFLKKGTNAAIDTDTAHRALQTELQTVLDNENPAGFDKVRFMYGGAEECILQIARVTQGDVYLYIYVCYASETYFSQRENEQESGEDGTADTSDIDF